MRKFFVLFTAMPVNLSRYMLSDTKKMYKKYKKENDEKKRGGERIKFGESSLPSH
jgi:hypothetical protein